jgi:hypothetical protein
MWTTEDESKDTDTGSENEPDRDKSATGRLMLATKGAKNLKCKKKRAPIMINEEVATAREVLYERSFSLTFFQDTTLKR